MVQSSIKYCKKRDELVLHPDQSIRSNPLRYCLVIGMVLVELPERYGEIARKGKITDLGVFA